MIVAHLQYRNGTTSDLTLRDPTYRGLRRASAALWVLHHTVVMLEGIEDKFEAWTETDGLPTLHDLERIRRIFGEEAVQRVREKFGIKKASARP